MIKSHLFGGNSFKKFFFKRYSNRLTKITALSKKLYFKSVFEKNKNDPRKL